MKITYSSITTLLLPLLAECNPIELQPRQGCDANNCLRQLRGTPTLASPYCLSYYTSTSTITTVVTIPALGATFPAIKKRELVTATPVANFKAREIMARSTTTPTYVSKCTEFPTALSSGCSCLLGSNAAVTKTTTTSTSTLPLPAACSSSNNYGLSNIPLILVSLPGGQGASGLGFDVLPGGCCAYCLASPNCFGYYQILNYVAQEPGHVGCSIEIIGEQPIEPLGNPTCPLGLVTFSTGPPETSILYGAGPCATILPTVK